MPSFDTVSEVDLQEVANAVDQTQREVGTRYDFKGTGAAVEQHEDKIQLTGDNEFQLDQIKDILYQKLSKRGVDIQALNAGKVELSIQRAKQVLDVQQGIPQETARRIIKLIKDAKLKVQASIQGDKVRVTGKKRDDLQAAIALLRGAELGLPLQFDNFRD